MRTESLLRHAGSIARALNTKRIEVGSDSASQRFTTLDIPEGFYLRVTRHMAMWVVPEWVPYQAFENAQVSFCRVMNPTEVAESVV